MSTNENQKHMLFALSLFKDGFKNQMKFNKSMFLCHTVNRNVFKYDYYRWDYGPFHKQIDSDIESLIKQELITIDHVSNERILKISKNGKDLIHSFNIDDTFAKTIQRTFALTNVLSRDALLNKIYQDFNIFQYEMGDPIILKD